MRVEATPMNPVESASRGRIAGWAVPSVVAAVQTMRLFLLVRLPDPVLTNTIPDDAFYYLTLARNFARFGRWTADGIEPASGFHLLWGYLLAAIFRLAPNLSFSALFAVAGALQIGCVTLAAWLACRSARRVFGPGAELGVACILLSTISLNMGLGMMETALVLLASAATCNALLRDQPAGLTIAAAVALGIAGTLARSDYLLLPLCLLGMHVALWLKSRGQPAMLRHALAVVAGAATGIAAIAFHTRWISGEWIQSSAQMKLHWSHISGPSLAPVRVLLFTFFDFASILAYVMHQRLWIPAVQRIEPFIADLLIVLIAAALVLSLRHKAARSQAFAIVALVASILAYAWLFRLSSTALFFWYIGQFEVPIALLAGAATCFFLRRFRRITIAACLVIAVCGVIPSFAVLDVAPSKLYEVGQYVRLHPELKPIGTWNSGVVGYFGGDEVVNLDGLVNDRILPYAKAGTLSQYVARRRIRNIMDYPFMFNPSFAAQGGYADGKLKSCLQENGPHPEAWNTPGIGPFTVYRVVPECLANR